MTVYVNAYTGEDSQVLGNIDGQGVIVAKDYKRTGHYKALKTFPTLENRIQYYRIVTPENRVLERIYNETYVG